MTSATWSLVGVQIATREIGQRATELEPSPIANMRRSAGCNEKLCVITGKRRGRLSDVEIIDLNNRQLLTPLPEGRDEAAELPSLKRMVRTSSWKLAQDCRQTDPGQTSSTEASNGR